MKKIITTVLVLGMALSMHAAFHLSIDKWVEDELVSTVITKDTTIIVTDYEYDEDLEEATMGVEGMMYSDDTQDISVTITRNSTGIMDQFCAGGSCMPGNGKLTQEMHFNVDTQEIKRSWFTHYTPTVAGNEVITYTFDDGINNAITLTVKYSYLTNGLESVIVPNNGNNVIYNILGKKMPTNDLNDLPAGIYIINGKKYIKQ